MLPFLESSTPLAFAHRGGASEVPENTMPAFQHAVDLGYRYIETDVHATADGVLLAFHDTKLDRITDSEGVISELPYSVVSRALVDGREPIPRLNELLAAWPELRINIDPKQDNAVDPLVAALRAHDAIDRVCIGSFSDARVRRIRAALGPRVCTSGGPKEIARIYLASRTSVARLRPPDGVHCAQVPVRQWPIPLVDERFVAYCHRHGLHVHVWTIDDASEMERLLDLGVDGLMTDRPIILKQVLQRRNAWT